MALFTACVYAYVNTSNVSSLAVDAGRVTIKDRQSMLCSNVSVFIDGVMCDDGQHASQQQCLYSAADGSLKLMSDST